MKEYKMIEERIAREAGCREVEILASNNPKIKDIIEMKGGRARNEKRIRDN